jgi:hypothetical protein
VSASFEKVNYPLRPGKFIERKMMIEALHRLRHFGPISGYQYVGFGTPFFADFQLVHKELGIAKMTCIELVESAKPRFEFNRPFRTIRLRWGHSNDVLPGVPMRERAICWLDYDGKLDGTCIKDLRSFVTRARSGSALIISVRAQNLARDLGVDGNDNEEEEVKAFLTEHFESRHVPPVPESLGGWKTAQLFTSILRNVVAETIRDINGGEPPNRKRACEQIFNFVYADGVPMLTMGWVIFSESDRPRFKRCNFKSLDFARDGPEPFEITTPVLTAPEMRYLNRRLPQGGLLRVPWLSKEDVDAYRRTYRHYPHFSPLETFS